MKTILVDDEPDGLATLEKMLQLNHPHLQILATCKDAFEAKKRIETLNPDLVFLDIAMPGKSGLEMLQDLKAIQFQIVFVTAHNEYILKALQYSATDYLLKPVDEDRLEEAIQRAEKRLETASGTKQINALLHNLHRQSSSTEMKLCLPTFKGFTVLKLEDIVYCEAETNYTYFHLTNGSSIVVSKPLLEYEKILEGTVFCRIHKSYLINLQHILEYYRGEGGFVLMTNGKEIEVSRRKKEYFLSRVKEVFRY